MPEFFTCQEINQRANQSLFAIFIVLNPVRFRVAHLAVAEDGEFAGGQRFESHGTVGVQFGGGNADLRAQSQFAVIGEAGGGIDRHHCRIHLAQKAL